MRLALQALFCHDPNLSGGERARIENELRNNARSVEFFRKIRQTISAPLRKAPEVFADESFPDPNIVAEYLDCQLESQEISEEYERVCAESPEILAEVADCYDLLNNRLPTPTTPPKNCRQHLYYVAWEEEPPHASTKETKKSPSSAREGACYTTSAAFEEPADEEPVIDVKVEPSARTNQWRDDPKRNEVRVKIKSKGSRFGRFLSTVKCVLVLIVVAGGINGYAKWRNLEKSQTFNAAGGVAQNDAVDGNRLEQPDRETSSSSFMPTEEDEFPAPFDGEDQYVDTDDGLGANDQSYPPMVTLRPDEPAISQPINDDGASAQGGNNERRGLGTANGGLRERIEIPDVNNDVFSGTKRY